MVGPGYAMPVPGLPAAESRVAVPAMALGQLVGVLTVDSPDPVAFSPADEAYLGVVASMLANAVEIERAQERSAEDEPGASAGAGGGRDVDDASAAPSTRVRFFAVDGSTFLDDDYLIKGVAGRHPVVAAAATTTARGGSSSPTRRCASIPPSSCPSSATTSRAA